MLSQLSLITAMLIAAIYPLCFLISSKDPLKNSFHRFHIGMPAVLGGVVLIFVLTDKHSGIDQVSTIIWEALLLGLCAYYWNKPCPKPLVMALASVVGTYAFFLILEHYLPSYQLTLPIIWATLLGGVILCSCLYAMNLGHWYLNVRGLPLSHLERASYVFWIALGIRGLWDLYSFATATVFYNGNTIPLYNFILKYDGFFLWIAIIFGLVFPFSSMFFVKGTLAVKNTQSTTGILYVILAGVLIGDMTFKYYLLKYGIAL